MRVATIDAGTTNTRTRIWQDGAVIGEADQPIGVRNTAIDGHNKKLVAAIHDTLQEAVEKSAPGEEISIILAAGMLTSNVGILEIPHVEAPVSMDELAAAMVRRVVPEISPISIWFVPGIKNMADAELTEQNIIDMDIMRGEETEVAGLLDRCDPQGRTVLVLPGSHNKYIALDDRQRIIGCMTTIGGELLHSLIFDTILADSAGRSFPAGFDPVAFRNGVTYGKDFGLGHAAFMARIMDMFRRASKLQVQNYLLGLLLADDLKSLKASRVFQEFEQTTFLIAGKSVMQQAYSCLFQDEGWQAEMVTKKQQQNLSGFGAIALAKRCGLFD